MTPAALKSARDALGYSQTEFARAIGMTGDNVDRTVRRWEAGEIPVPGPVALLVKLLQHSAKTRVLVLKTSAELLSG